MILIAGATGTVGRQLVLELKTRRAPVRVSKWHIWRQAKYRA